MTSFRAAREAVYDAQGRSDFNRDHLRGLSAWDRHKLFLQQYQRDTDESAPAPVAAVHTDVDALTASHQFIRDDDEDARAAPWAARLARKYYAKLVKEYAICDLSRYKESKVGLRWRTEREVVVGKGQFVCAARGCSARLGLVTFELPFSYTEAGQAKQALVKVRVCEECGVKLNWKKERKIRQLEKALQKHTGTGKRGASGDAEDPADGKRRKPLIRDLDVDGDASQHKSPSSLDLQLAASASQAASTPADNSGAHWKQTHASKEADLDDEFDQYLNDLFL